ncbi:MAG: type II toxin-antitoxin system VapC family toxin, partial [Candidatus Latescibacteria bacterium]|nr:type II toxin-antitoxin system VapC family toxin [Candidatus Latescibacterota bacterium]
MRYMLDTNICIYLIKKKPAQVIQKFRKEDIEDIGISSITLSELEYGVEKSEYKDRNRFALTHFLAPLQIVSYDAQAAQQYGFIRSQL